MMSIGGFAGVVGNENFDERARPDLPYKRVGFRAPSRRRPDHGIDGQAEALLSAIGGIVDILPSRPTNDKDVQVIRRFSRLLLIPGCPRAKNQH
jgi:hypothetical protein